MAEIDQHFVHRRCGSVHARRTILSQKRECSIFFSWEVLFPRFSREEGLLGRGSRVLLGERGERAGWEEKERGLLVAGFFDRCFIERSFFF